MKTLGIDTTTRWGSIAVLEDGRLVGAQHASGALDHAERLLPSIEVLLSRLGIQAGALSGIGVTQGPGSFTGVRIGLATAAGLARAWGLPALGVSALEALAASVIERVPGGWICPWIDAGRGEIYAAAYARQDGVLRQRRAPSLEKPDEWIRGLPACSVVFLGEGARVHREVIRATRGDGALPMAGPWYLAPDVARQAENLLRAAPEGPWSALEPIYLRPSDAELGRGKRR